MGECGCSIEVSKCREHIGDVQMVRCVLNGPQVMVTVQVLSYDDVMTLHNLVRANIRSENAHILSALRKVMDGA